MGHHRPVPLALAALAVTSGLAMLIFNIIFSITLSRQPTPIKADGVACVASVISGISLALLSLLLCRQIRSRDGAYVQDSGHERHHTYLLAAFCGVFWLLSIVASAVLLGIIRHRIGDLPKRTVYSSTHDLVIGAFVVWSISLLSQAAFVIGMVISQRKKLQKQDRSLVSNREPQMYSDKQRLPLAPASVAPRQSNTRGSVSMDSRSPPSSSGRSRAASDTVSSFRSSISHVVRPMTSKTRLVHTSHKSTYSPSLESEHRERSRSLEDGFDSWDTSMVDAQARDAMHAASPTPPRFLETIPASPTVSRSPSPGFPLDFPFSQSRKRSRSYSPASNYRASARTLHETSPVESNAEAHIHPLFRSDSPTPPPGATRNTVIVAAPGAGQVISNRASVRSLQRMRSESLPISPLAHSQSLDSFQKVIEREEWNRLEQVGTQAETERKLTPPIPDFIMNGGSRNSIYAFQSRKKAPTSNLTTALHEAEEP